MTDIVWRSATELAGAVRSGDLSPDEIAAAAVDRVEQVNPTINAVVAFDRDQVLRDARALTDAVSRGDELGPLHGVPFTIKDLTTVAGLPTTFGMIPMKDNVADADALVGAARDRSLFWADVPRFHHSVLAREVLLPVGYREGTSIRPSGPSSRTGPGGAPTRSSTS